MEFDYWEVWKIHSLIVREKVLLFHKGQQKKRKGDVMWNHGVNNTPLILGETTRSISTQGNNVVNLLDFMIELGFAQVFSWAFRSYMLKFDISLWASLLYTIILLFIPSFKINQYEMKWYQNKLLHLGLTLL